MSVEDMSEWFKAENIGNEFDRNRQQSMNEANDWWESASEEDREKAFFAVIDRMYRAEVDSHGTYRYSLYDVFGFRPSMYVKGMQCGYMALHNLIHTGIETHEELVYTEADK